MKNDINEVLFEYVTNPSTWFFWYHNPKRLKVLYDEDYDHKNNYCKKDYIYDRCDFKKNVWRFKEKTVVNKNRNIVVIQNDLFDFFNAVLDETRIKRANSFAEYALYISDNEDLAYFRDTVTKRELSADIDHNKQRDHAVHTLYNYILGWYIFEYSGDLFLAFKTYFMNSDINLNSAQLTNEHKAFYGNNGNFCKINNIEFNDSVILVNEFADVWHIASLLHDIGYILEGNLSSASPEVENARIINGSKIIHDYFNHYFWKIFEVDFRVAKNIAKILGVVVPDFKNSESLSSLGDHLCDIGSCENIRRQLQKVKGQKFNNLSYELMKDYDLNREAISIWKKYYQIYGTQKMQDILHIVEKVYRNNIWIGADHGKRNIDHGICSGLITLQALTFFRELYWGFCDTDWKDFDEKREKLEHINISSKQISCNIVSESMFDMISFKVTHIPNRIKIRGDFLPEFWFKKILWATVSTAIHSIIQDPEYRKKCKEHINPTKLLTKNNHLKIGYDDDPLAFLGVLVDILQEWDRYTVTRRGESAFSGVEPLQHIDVGLKRNSRKILLKYPPKSSKNNDKDWKKDLTENLSNCLENWKDIVNFY